jgi:hypothetical protein
LADEIRNTSLIIGVESASAGAQGSRRLFCAHKGEEWYALTFLDRSIAEGYFARESAAGKISTDVQLIECRGLDLLQVLCTQEQTLGLEIISASADKLVTPALVAIMANIRETNQEDLASQHYHLAHYGGTVSRELSQQLNLFCGQHPHIGRLYICDKILESQKTETLVVLVGDRTASNVNIVDLLGEVAIQIGLDGWEGEIAWITPEEDQILQRLGLEATYIRKPRP